MSETEGVTVRVGDPSDVASAIPHLLGFQPAESVVAVSLRGRRMRMAFTVRLDLPTSKEEHDYAVRTVAGAMRRDGAAEVLLFVYTETTHAEEGLPFMGLVDAMADALSMPVREAFLVSGDRIWNYGCADPQCCPADGRRLDPTTQGALALSAASTLLGRAVLPDRKTAVGCVQPVGGLTAVSMHQAIARVAGRFADSDGVLVRAEVRRLWAELLERYREPPATVTHDEAAAVALGLHFVELRDEVLQEIDDRDDAHERLLLDLVRLAQPPADAPVCTVLACAAYLAGNGVVAGAALDRALRTDADYSLAHLLDDALISQIHPRDLRRALPF